MQRHSSVPFECSQPLALMLVCFLYITLSKNQPKQMGVFMYRAKINHSVTKVTEKRAHLIYLSHVEVQKAFLPFPVPN